jgi:regulatory protein
MSGKITALKVQKRNRERVNVYLDGKFAFGLARIVAAWLRVGQDLSDERIAELKAQDDKEATYQKVLRYLSYRERSEAEIRQYLLRSGLVDDRRFAQRWVENRSEFRPRGRRALSYELRQKGIPNQIIDEVVEQIDEAELAYQAALKRSEKLSQFQWPVFRKKMYAYLSRRGFSYDTAANIVNRVWEETKNTDAS